MVQPYTKSIIREEFIYMLNEKPINKITVKELAERCDINRNTFYYHYSDIYQLLSELFHIELEKVIDEYNDTLSWEESFIMAADFAIENKRAVYHIYNSMQREELVDYIYRVAGSIMSNYVERMSKDIDSDEYDRVLISSFYQCALTEMVLRWIATGMKQDPKEIVRRIGKLFDGNIELSLKRSETLKMNESSSKF